MQKENFFQLRKERLERKKMSNLNECCMIEKESEAGR